METSCGYCLDLFTEEDDFLNCEICLKNIHLKCLKQKTPGDLQGDIFFKFTCSNCAGEDEDDSKEIFVRSKMLWAMVIVLVIYNLSIKSRGLSRLGYFHWRTHIVNYIEKNWEYIFGLNAKKKKTLVGTIAGCLSHNNPTIFTSGQDIFKEAGWWKLSQNEKPSFFNKMLQQDKKQGKKIKDEFQDLSPISSPTSATVLPSNRQKFMDFFREVDAGNQCSRTIPYIASKNSIPLTPEPLLESIEPDNLNTVQSSLMDFLAETLTSDGMIFNDEIPHLDTSFDMKSPQYSGKLQNEIPNLENFSPRIVQVTNFQNINNEDKVLGTEQNIVSNYNKSTLEDYSKHSETEIKEHCEPSFFTKSVKRSYPWLEEEAEINDYYDQCPNMILMNENKENEYYYKLKRIVHLEDQLKIEIPHKIRRLYRKLQLRNYKRCNGKQIFDIDSFNTLLPSSKTVKSENIILDKYYLLSASNTNKKSFHARIVGSLQFDYFESPYTGRVLHPFIYRDSNLVPPWLKLMCELQSTVNNQSPSRSSIDFCYIRPNHIAAVNALLQSVFWPGIDMSETLSYPDYTIVALYKKLVVGCAFLAPDIKCNEAYISFMAVRPTWQRAGIGTFMLYHLLQICISKDITLHVSASNTAICLYQKFGFKIEEVILDFYEKYMPYDCRQSRHAFLLRLQGTNLK